MTRQRWWLKQSAIKSWRPTFGGTVEITFLSRNLGAYLHIVIAVPRRSIVDGTRRWSHLVVEPTISRWWWSPLLVKVSWWWGREPVPHLWKFVRRTRRWWAIVDPPLGKVVSVDRNRHPTAPMMLVRISPWRWSHRWPSIALNICHHYH